MLITEPATVRAGIVEIGGADALSFSGAIDVGYEVVRQQLLSQIGELIAKAHSRLAQNSADAAAVAAAKS